MDRSSHPHERLLSVLSHGVNRLDEGERLTFLDVNKILYYLEKRLDEDNELREFLIPFWYQDGPMVTAAQAVVDRGRSAGAFEEAGGWFYPSQASHELPEDDDVREAKVAIEAVLAEDYPISTSLDEKLEQVYEDAPFEFQRQFKRRVLPMSEKLDSVPPILPDEVYKAVNTAEAYLPLADGFEEVNQCYSEYLDVSRAFLTSDESFSQKEVKAYIELSESYWVLFCMKLRLETVSTDIDEHRLNHWQEVYRDTLAGFRTELIDFEDVFLNPDADPHQPVRVSEDSSWGKIANELLNNSD